MRRAGAGRSEPVPGHGLGGEVLWARGRALWPAGTGRGTGTGTGWGAKAFTVSTAQGACRTTRSVTLPMSSRSSPLRPRVAITTRSIPPAFTCFRIPSTGLASVTTASSASGTPASSASARSFSSQASSEKDELRRPCGSTPSMSMGPPSYTVRIVSRAS